MTSLLQGKKIILCISGSIAAYKSAFLTRLLIKQGAEVRVIMTPAACHFISPLTLSTLSKHKVHTDVIDGGDWDNHVELGLWADLMVVAPATATTLAKMATGVADNMLVASYLSAKCPVHIAPAMDLDMWKHPSTISNIKRLKSYGNEIIPVGNGELASGLVGEGRMAEPIDIVRYISGFFVREQDLAGKNVLITAGPTFEAIDPVRFIGNHSSGRMGIALAESCAARGAHVTLVLGPTHLSTNHSRVEIISVFSAEDMFQACRERWKQTDIGILAAAVADYRPTEIADQKIKKKDGNLEISLERTTDIAAFLGEKKKTGQILVGFALETQNAMENAQSKLKRKNFDMIVLNSLADPGAGFKLNTNKVTIIHKSGDFQEFPLKSKNEVAEDIVNDIVRLQQEK